MPSRAVNLLGDCITLETATSGVSGVSGSAKGAVPRHHTIEELFAAVASHGIMPRPVLRVFFKKMDVVRHNNKCMELIMLQMPIPVANSIRRHRREKSLS